MNYIQFDGTLLPNLEYSLFREILQTNRAGAYLSSSIVGCNTRKYHGLLVCPLKEFGGKTYVMLSSLQCSIAVGEKPFNLGVQEYKGDYFEPKGHKYMIGYEAAPTSTFTYASARSSSRSSSSSRRTRARRSSATRWWKPRRSSR